MATKNMHFKEVSPQKTIDKIRNILRNIGIEVDENYGHDETIDTYSVRLTIKGTEVGSNGKGVDKIFAEASAYAEFIERLQNNVLINDISKTDDEEIKFIFEPDEKILSSEEIMSENNSFMQQYFKLRGMENATFDEKVQRFNSVQKLDYMMRNEKNQFLTVPFYSMKNNVIANIPVFALRAYYGSNGMSAGNSEAEAIVQGISEILERYVQDKLFHEKLVFPDIPYEYIKKYPYITERYDILQNRTDYIFKLKDCSLGGKYPVVALVGIEKNTGKYGIKFGCHPDLGIAMERTLTEATQGRSIFEHTHCSIFDFNNKNVDSAENIMNVCKVGIGSYPYEFFSNDATFEFTPVEDVSGLNNDEILNKMLKKITDDGYDILIRDVSCLGFPSYHIIIPGMSEIKNANDNMFRIYNTESYCIRVLRDIKNITEEDCLYISTVANHFVNSYLENNVRRFFPNCDDKYEFPRDYGFSGIVYLSCMCYVFRKEYDKALHCLKVILKTIEVHNVEVAQEEQNILLAMKYYFEGMDKINNHKVVMGYIEQLVDNEIANYIDELFIHPEKVLIKQYSDIPHNNNEVSRITKEVKRKVNLVKQRNVIDMTHFKSLLRGSYAI